MVDYPIRYGTASDSFENRILNHVFKSASFTGSLCYLALYTGNPGDSDCTSIDTLTTTEISGNGYLRQGISGSWIVSNASAVLNSTVTFPVATGSWGWVTHFGIRNGETAGTSTTGSLLFYGEFSASRYVSQNDVFSVQSGSLTVMLTGAYSNYLAGKILSHYLNSVVYPTPGSCVYASLYNTIAGSNVELSGSGYVRIPACGTGSWITATNGSTSNLYPVIFSTSASASWGNITGTTLYTLGINGEKLFETHLKDTKTVITGDGFQFAPGTLKITVD